MNEEILDVSAAEFDENELVDSSDDYVETPKNEPQPEESEKPSDPQQPSQESEEIDDDDSFTREILKLKGIKDPHKIKFEDASGAIIEKSWNDLSKNEQLSILSLEEDTDTDLEDEEISFINMLRSNNLTPSQYIRLLQNNIEQRIIDYQPETYEIDSLNDDELFALDLIEKLGEDNVTDDELQQALIQAKANPDFYAKQVESLREHYKELENERRYEEEQTQRYQYENAYRNFSAQVLNQIEGFQEIAGQEIELSVDDKNDIANYLLTRDNTGQSDFYKDLQNPQVLTKAAFWMLKGPEIMQELQGQIQQAYQRGYYEGNSKGGAKQTSQPTVVIAPKPTVQTPKVINDANAAFGDDESYLYN